jgi:Tfp pilus assembly protein PilF
MKFNPHYSADDLRFVKHSMYLAKHHVELAMSYHKDGDYEVAANMMKNAVAKTRENHPDSANISVRIHSRCHEVYGAARLLYIMLANEPKNVSQQILGVLHDKIFLLHLDIENEVAIYS